MVKYFCEISHNISYPYIERCVVPWYVNISKLLDLRARKYFDAPPPPPKKKKRKKKKKEDMYLVFL